MIDLAQVPTTDAELVAKYAARREELHRQLDALAAHRRRMSIIAIRPTILHALRQPSAIDRASTCRINLPDGRTVVISGGELLRAATGLVRLNGALAWGGEATVRRYLRRLQGRQR